MSQSAAMTSWDFATVDEKLQQIMKNIYKNASTSAKEFGMNDNFVVGANIAGFKKVADTMLMQGVC